MPTKTTKIPKVNPKKWSEEEEFIQEWQDMVDAGIQINEDDIPDEMLDVWEEFKEDIKPKIAKKNWMLWSAIFTPLILPSFVRGVVGAYELPPDAKKPSTPLPPPKPAQIVDYARQYFQDHGLELCKTLSETDLKQLKQQLIENWGKGEKSFKESFKQDYIDSKARLDTIYRTEYVTAQNEGMLARAKDAGHQFKVWNCPLDERSCPICSDLHSTTVPMEDEFPGGVMRPPAHPNCRCVITTLSEDDINQENVQEDASYLNDVATFMKLNYNCPDSEKVGSGPGSCSGGKAEQSPKERLVNIDKTLSDLDNQIIEHIRLGNTLDINNADEKTKTEYRKKSSELQSKKHELEVEKALLTFKEPKGPQRKVYNKLVEISEAARNSTYPEAVTNYVASSAFMTAELIKRPDMKREVLDEADFDNFQNSNNLAGTIWYGPTHNNIAKLDKVMSESNLPEDMTLYTGISKDLWDQIPKEPNSEFKNITFLSTTIDPKIAKGFALRGKKSDRTKPKFAYYAEIRAKSGTPGIATEQAALRQNPLGTWIIGEGGKPGAGGSQQEVILSRGQHYKVVGVEDESKFKKIIMETI